LLHKGNCSTHNEEQHDSKRPYHRQGGLIQVEEKAQPSPDLSSLACADFVSILLCMHDVVS